VSLRDDEIGEFGFLQIRPLTLGREGDYHFERLTSNRYAQLHGMPTGTAFWGQDRQGPFLVLGFEDTPMLVRRAPLPGETWTSGRPPPPPVQTPFALRGRLLAEAQAPAYRDAFQRGRQLSGLRPKDGQLWIVVEGERPVGLLHIHDCLRVGAR